MSESQSVCQIWFLPKQPVVLRISRLRVMAVMAAMRKGGDDDVGHVREQNFTLEERKFEVNKLQVVCEAQLISEEYPLVN